MGSLFRPILHVYAKYVVKPTTVLNSNKSTSLHVSHRMAAT